MKSKQGSEPPVYKHREILTWRGLSYRYDKSYGVWCLVDKPAPFAVPTSIMEWRRNGGVTQWEAKGFRAKDPVAALEGWNASLVELRTREAGEAEELAKSLRAEVRRLRSKNLKV